MALTITEELILQLAENNSFSEELLKREYPTVFETPTDIITIVEKYGKDKLIKIIENL